MAEYHIGKTSMRIVSSPIFDEADASLHDIRETMNKLLNQQLTEIHRRQDAQLLQDIHQKLAKWKADLS